MDQHAINQGAFNSGSDLLDPTLLSLGSGISLGGFSLCGIDAGVTIQYNDNQYTNKFYDNQYIDGQRLISHLMKDKRLTMDFVLKGTDMEDLQIKIDNFKTAIAGQKTGGVVNFTVNIAGETRVLKVITENTKFNLDGIHTPVQSGTVTIVAIDPPRFYSYLLSSKYYQNITTNFNGQVNNYGSAITYPVYYFVFTTATGVTELKRTVNGYEVIINKPIVDGDIVIISSDIYGLIKDSDTYYNNVPTNSIGQITTPLTTGSNNISFECDGTYDVDITIIYHNMRE